jgi:uncharacterized protein (TIGR03083 family)
MLQLTRREYKQHGEVMGLELVANPSRLDRVVRSGRQEIPVQAGHGVYAFENVCGHLDDHDRCSIHSSRPDCCRQFRVGSPECLALRRRAGLDGGSSASDEAGVHHTDSGGVGHLLPLLAGGSANETDATRLVIQPDLAPRELAVLVAQAGRWIADTLTACDAAAWLRQTRCPPWSVADLGAHLVDGQLLAQRLLGAALRRERATSPEPFEGDNAGLVKAFRLANGAVVEYLTQVTPDVLHREVELDQQYAVAIEHLVLRTVSELVIHGLDVADALGVGRGISADEARVVARAVPEMLDPVTEPQTTVSYALSSVAFDVALTWRAGQWRPELGRNPCRIEGDPEAVLMYVLGRESFAPARLTTNDSVRARAFRTYLGGP